MSLHTDGEGEEDDEATLDEEDALAALEGGDRKVQHVPNPEIRPSDATASMPRLHQHPLTLGTLCLFLSANAERHLFATRASQERPFFCSRLDCSSPVDACIVVVTRWRMQEHCTSHLQFAFF